MKVGEGSKFPFRDVTPLREMEILILHFLPPLSSPPSPLLLLSYSSLTPRCCDLKALSPVLIERMQKYAARLPDGGGKPKSEGGWLSPLSKRLQEGSPPPLVKWSLAQEIGSDESPLKEAKRLSTSPIV